MCVWGGGINNARIKEFHYIGSDISELMNEGAVNFHSDVKMDFLTQDTISKVVRDVKEMFGRNLSLFYGLSVSVRYAVRTAIDLIEVAERTELSIYNRLSLTYDSETLVSVYGTGKSVYIISLPMLIKGLSERGIFAKYCMANMQYNKDGEKTVRASIAISKHQMVLDEFIRKYDECIDKSIHIEGVEKGEWKDLKELYVCR